MEKASICHQPKIKGGAGRDGSMRLPCPLHHSSEHPQLSTGLFNIINNLVVVQGGREYLENSHLGSIKQEDF